MCVCTYVCVVLFIRASIDQTHMRRFDQDIHESPLLDGMTGGSTEKRLYDQYRWMDG